MKPISVKEIRFLINGLKPGITVFFDDEGRMVISEPVHKGRRIDISEAKFMRKSGKSFKAIGEKFGVSKQAVEQLLTYESSK